MRRTRLLPALLVVACGGSTSGDGSSSAGSSSSAAPAESSSDEGPGDAPEHGVVEIEFARPEDQASFGYVGTAQVVATLQYRECLTAFYTTHPELRADGPAGAVVFADWHEQLCAVGDGVVACTVVSIEQQLVPVAQLTVVYAVESAELEDLRVRFGPLPTAATAMCTAGLSPSVRVGGGDAVQGLDAGGAQAWRAAAYSPAEAVTDDGPIIRVTPEG